MNTEKAAAGGTAGAHKAGSNNKGNLKPEILQSNTRKAKID